MSSRYRGVRRLLSLALTILLVVSACGGGATTPEVASSTIAPKTTTALGGKTTASTRPAGPAAVATVEQARGAVLRIVAQGTHADPAGTLAAYTESTGVFSGSGFIIDPSGIAVTNNHVVTGAATLEVVVGGSDESVNARVLGVSECFDLAVLQLEGDGYPFFEFRDGAVDPGLKVFAAGFPLGDPEYTLLDGIVAKARADGDTNWASVDSVIEHTA
ncbi:MAG TPA: serine protease, partial [Acidimicrobiales bacterium]|nr:serine protease [Acidimicrobiales bacterium]